MSLQITFQKAALEKLKNTEHSFFVSLCLVLCVHNLHDVQASVPAGSEALQPQCESL